jgi:hypothetical protein
MIRKHALAALSLLLLPACVGGTLGDTSEFEMFPLRPATRSEGKDLKRCLKAAHAAQEAHRRRFRHYARKVRELSLDDACGDLMLRQKSTSTGYEIRAEIHEDETAVRWSVNEKGVIEEHLEPEGDVDLEF